MTTFYLVRHGQTLWSLAAQRALKGWGNDLVPLTPQGIEQIEQVAVGLRGTNVRLILCSPMTRALQSASILSRRLDLPLTVEFDLHEWIPDRTFCWQDLATVEAAFAEFSQLGGEWPPGEQRQWEPRSAIRLRMLGVLTQYGDSPPIVVVSHSVAISSVTGRPPELAEVSEYRL